MKHLSEVWQLHYVGFSRTVEWPRRYHSVMLSKSETRMLHPGHITRVSTVYDPQCRDLWAETVEWFEMQCLHPHIHNVEQLHQLLESEAMELVNGVWTARRDIMLTELVDALAAASIIRNG